MARSRQLSYVGVIVREPFKAGGAWRLEPQGWNEVTEPPEYPVFFNPERVGHVAGFFRQMKLLISGTKKVNHPNGSELQRIDNGERHS
jgi:hypothetical protein